MAKNRMTKFLAKELMYDYLSGSLDEKKSKSVQTFIEEDEDLKKEMAAISKSINYAVNLKRITLTQPYYQSLSDYVQKEGSIYYIKRGALASFKYGSIAAAIALLIIYFPTDKIINYFQRDPNKVVLAQIETTDELENVPMAMHGDMDEEGETVLGDEESHKHAEVSSAENQNPAELSHSEKKVLEHELRKQDEALKTAAKEEAQKPVEPVIAKEAVNKPALQGLLFRAFLKVNDQDMISSAIVQKLQELGAEKAGSVKLGWQKPNGNAYFHFKITKSNFEIFKTYINTIKKIEINSYPHPRVMESGYVRMILEVENQ